LKQLLDRQDGSDHQKGDCMIMSTSRRRGERVRRFEELTDAEVVALAISNEQDATRTYTEFADALRDEYPESARLFAEMADEEMEHHARLTALFHEKFGDIIPQIAAGSVRGVAQEVASNPARPDGAEAMRRRARQMEDDAVRFYHQAAGRVSDAAIRRVFAALAEAEAAHENTAGDLDPNAAPTPARVKEVEVEKKRFVLRVIQPGLVGLMDGSVSTLAPVFAAAFATHNTFNAFLVGLAASLGAGISMGFAEALADDGRLSGRGAPLTIAGGIGHTLPYLIPTFWTATAIAAIIAVIELLAIAWIQWRYMDTPPVAAAAKVMLGGAVVLTVGVLIGNS
jgi:rubrerythrin